MDDQDRLFHSDAVALKPHAAELAKILDTIPQLIAVISRAGAVLYVNKTVLTYTGFQLDDIKTGNFRSRLFHPDDLRQLNEMRAHGLGGNHPFELEIRTWRHDGVYRWCHVHYEPLLDSEGQVLRWHATGTDIDERKRMEERINNENLVLREEIQRVSAFDEIVGSSDALLAVLHELKKVAATDATVLIRGETGTGKELIARAIHKQSPRSNRPFVSVNCAAIATTLVTSELFGHERGAFTGALAQRKGRFELADGGTIFLDEVGELPIDAQAILLRVLQEREFERVGGSRSIKVDVRIIAATNRDLQAAVCKSTFRADLFYRLSVFPLEMPPLRRRVADISLLAEYFIRRIAKSASKAIRRIDRRSLEMLQRYPWPGNIRELQNIIERAVIVAETDTLFIDERWLNEPHEQMPGNSLSLGDDLTARESDRIEAALATSMGKISGPKGAAALLGIPRSTLESRIRALKIDKHRFKSSSAQVSGSDTAAPRSRESALNGRSVLI